jgi:hypothetical protein
MQAITLKKIENKGSQMGHTNKKIKKKSLLGPFDAINLTITLS